MVLEKPVDRELKPVDSEAIPVDRDTGVLKPVDSPVDKEVSELSVALVAVLSWATFTASVGAIPAARLVSWRVRPAPPPILTAPSVLSQVELVFVEETRVEGSQPYTPEAVLATLPAPRATPPRAVTLAVGPSATPYCPVTRALAPSATEPTAKALAEGPRATAPPPAAWAVRPMAMALIPVASAP